MIFCSRNEDGIEKWRMVVEDIRIDPKVPICVTRRLKPIPVGKDVALQPGRGKKAIGRIRVKSCQSHARWSNVVTPKPPLPMTEFERLLDEEAHREGFRSWDGLLKWFKDHKISILDTFRIEFELLSFCDVCHAWFKEPFPGIFPSIICPKCVEEARD